MGVGGWRGYGRWLASCGKCCCLLSTVLSNSLLPSASPTLPPQRLTLNHTHTHAHTHTRTHTHAHARTYTHAHKHTLAHTTRAHTYTYSHTHMHTYRERERERGGAERQRDRDRERERNRETKRDRERGLTNISCPANSEDHTKVKLRKLQITHTPKKKKNYANTIYCHTS